ncbi:MAG TPA: hypothetical protein VHW47_01725 [Acidimicrobiales bacterium]|jgi:cytochrome c-type biogenesis protein CcmH/NrfG|nr:hypothetical protein [Acidimicrobiales bacterium]
MSGPDGTDLTAPGDGVGPAHRSATARPALDGEERWRLQDRRDFLRRSLDDAEREHEAGDLADEDYLVLRRRDENLLAEVEKALGPVQAETELADGGVASEEAAGPGPAPADGPAAGDRQGAKPAGLRSLTLLELDDDEVEADRTRSRHHRLWLALVGTAALVAGAVLLVVNLTSPRLPGQTATGGITTTQTQQIQRALAQAAVLVQEGKSVEALQLYKQILSLTPSQPQALAEWGWLDWEAAKQAGNLTLAASGRSAVARATQLDPSLYAAHLYLGTILLGQGQPGQAVTQYKAFLADHPPKGWVTKGAPYIRQAFSQAHQPLPAEVAKAG